MRGKQDSQNNMMTKNEQNMRMIAMLRYQAQHYQMVGRGAMVQQLNAKIRRLTTEMSAGAVKS